MASNGDDISKKVGHGVTRRTVVKGAAWSVPAVIIATASPAAATVSGTMAATAATGLRPAPGSGSGGRVVNFTVTFAGTSPGIHQVTFTSVTSAGRTWTINSGAVQNLPAGGGSLTFQATSSTNLAANVTGITIFYTITDHGSGSISATITN